MDLKLGDLVLLKSGGGLCVVIELFETHVEVAWSDGKHNYQTTYPRAALRKVALSDISSEDAGYSPSNTH